MVTWYVELRSRDTHINVFFSNFSNSYMFVRPSSYFVETKRSAVAVFAPIRKRGRCCRAAVRLSRSC